MSKPYPSVSFDVNPIEIPYVQNDETITCNKQIQLVESQELSEAESH